MKKIKNVNKKSLSTLYIPWSGKVFNKGKDNHFSQL